MRVTREFKDYEILDCTDGEKLERWGKYTLVRPDPQVIWRPERSPGFINCHAVYHRSKSGGGSWEFKGKLPQEWRISYKALTFKVSPTGFKHLGLFPEQAVNWDFIIDKIKSAGRQINVLNLFAYTGGATLAAAFAGAKVCHVDASKGMVSWARDNAELSGLSGRPVRWIVDDCRAFVEREIRRGVRYDAVIMDPPSYGRGPSGEIWKLEEQIYELLKLTAGVLSDNPLFFILNSYTTGLSASVMKYLLAVTVGERFSGELSADEIGLTVKSTGAELPCGTTAIWESRQWTVDSRQ